jgi:hypothetical protein
VDTRTRQAGVALCRLIRVPGLAADPLGRVLSAWLEEPALVDGFWNRPAAEYRERWGVPARAARYLQEAEEDEEAGMAEAAYLAAQGAGIEQVSLLDAAFAALAAARGLPPVLFTRGNQDHLWQAGAAIPHSRDAGEEALAWGGRLAKALSEAGTGIVTGHNRDGYRRAAAAAKRAGAPLTVVLDRPLHDATSQGPGAEPVLTARLWDDRFRPERELVVSAVLPGARWLPSHAQARDALIIHLAEVVVAGDVRRGGNLAPLCARAATASRLVFRSPYCRAEIDAPSLPGEPEAAAVVIGQALSRRRETAPGIEPAMRHPGWVARRWEAEREAFAASLSLLVAEWGWVERRPASSPIAKTIRVAAIVQLPGVSEVEPDQAVLVGRRDGNEAPDLGEQVLLLSPGEPIQDLAGLRAYLSRCRTRMQEALRNQRH